jgi:hypothetical protein
MADYIPSNDAVFGHWFKFMNQYVNQKCTGASPAWTPHSSGGPDGTGGPVRRLVHGVR